RRRSAFCYVLADGTRLAGTSSWGWRRCGAGLVDYCGESAGSPPGLRAARVTSEAIESRHCHTELGGVEDGQMGKIVLPGATKDALKAAPELQYAAAPSPSVAAPKGRCDVCVADRRLGCHLLRSGVLHRAPGSQQADAPAKLSQSAYRRLQARIRSSRDRASSA